MKDQGDDCSEQQLQDILHLKVKLVFGSPEAILNNYRHIVVLPFSASVDFLDDSKLSLTSRIFRTTVSFLSAQFWHKMFVRSEPSPLDISFPAINSRFKQALVFFWPPDIVNFRLKSLYVITLVQGNQICPFDAGETHTRSIVLVGVEPILSNIQFNPSVI